MYLMSCLKFGSNRSSDLTDVHVKNVTFLSHDLVHVIITSNSNKKNNLTFN